MKNAWFEWGLGVAAAALMGTGLAVVGVTSRPVQAASLEPTVDPRVALAAVTSADQFEAASSETKHLSVERNETLSGLLDRLGAPRDQANGAVIAAGQLVDLRSMRPGDDITAWLETDQQTGGVRLMGLSMRPDAARQVLVQRDLNGSWTTHELKAKL
ncbi:MAG TPA: hypothetical protein VG942_18535, partial [Hyphomonadaceae bacterium]|nr:hypothetical protein [Hyphomonadaceae bacterium]